MRAAGHFLWWTVRLVGEGTSRAPAEPTDAPDGVQTREALAQALDQLRRQAGFQSKRSLTSAAERRGLVLPKSTVDDAISGRRIPTDETLQAFLAVCGMADEEGVQAWLRAAARARQGDSDRPAGAVCVAAAVPRLLGGAPGDRGGWRARRNAHLRPTRH